MAAETLSIWRGYRWGRMVRLESTISDTTADQTPAGQTSPTRLSLSHFGGFSVAIHQFLLPLSKKSNDGSRSIPEPPTRGRMSQSWHGGPTSQWGHGLK